MTMYLFTATPKLIKNNQLYNKLPMYVINFVIIYGMVNIFSIKKYQSLRKLRVGQNWYMGVNWSTTTNELILTVMPVIYFSVKNSRDH